MPWSVAPHILNVIVAAFLSVNTNVYQFVRAEQKAPDNTQADSSQQNCGSMSPLWHLHFLKCVYHRCDRAASCTVPCFCTMGVYPLICPFIQSGLPFIVWRHSRYRFSVCCVVPRFGPTVRSAVRCEGTQVDWTAGRMNMAGELLCYCLFYATRLTVLFVWKTNSLHIQSIYTCDIRSYMFRRSTAPPSLMSQT